MFRGYSAASNPGRGATLPPHQPQRQQDVPEHCDEREAGRPAERAKAEISMIVPPSAEPIAAPT